MNAMTQLEGKILRKRYRVLRLLGRGGMADVYLARDMVRESQVAVKVLRSDLATDALFMQRFAHEARSLVQLHYPNIVQFFALERDGELVFIVMDYIDGITLRAEIARRTEPLSFFETIHTLTGVAHALDYAHTQRLVHRDIKPGNIILARNGRVMLTDFGIAQAAETRGEDMPSLGTPAYMSPEQILDRPIGFSTDIYSLGVTLFEMATRQRPFTGRESGLTSTTTTDRVKEAHLRLSPPDPRLFNPQLPEAAAQIILRAMDKTPERRWASARQMARAWDESVQPLLGVERTLAWVSHASPSIHEQAPFHSKSSFPSSSPSRRSSAHVDLPQPDPPPALRPTPLVDADDRLVRLRLAFGIMAVIITITLCLSVFVMIGSY